MRPACSYDRVSTSRQAECVDLDARYLDAIKAHCLRNNWQLGPHFTDPGKSGKNAKRPGLQAAIQWAVENRGVIVFYDLTRFSRSLADVVNIAEQLKAKGAAISSATEAVDTSDDNPAGILTFHVLAACAEFQRRLIGSKIKHKNDETVKARGFRTNGEQPYGWKLVEDQRVPVRAEQRALRLIRKLRDSNKRYIDIAITLNAKGLVTRRGRSWSGKAAWRALKSNDKSPGGLSRSV